MGVTSLQLAASLLTCLQALYFTFFELVLSFEKKRVSSEEGDMTCPLLLLLPSLVFAALTSSTVDAARAPEPGFLSLLGSNGHQGGREKILPTPCTFQAAQCQA